ncbi:hypothetical protein ACCO45_009905 [Purpureocillium lilacinum]|uniref:Uncharacterized protein n=1 Tax=Purpureocillium lilacinum TaxID=33203 RepID=A0ACC4DDY0_PURLI
MANTAFLGSAFSSSASPYPLLLSAILDSGSTLHIFNDLRRFKTIRKATKGECVVAGTATIPVLGFGKVELDVTKPDGSPGKLRLNDVAYCTDFNTNLVSFQLLQEKGIYWDTINNRLIRRDGTILCVIQKKHKQYVLQYREVDAENKHAAFSILPEATIMGHPSPLSLQKLGANSLGVRLRGPKTTECQHCSQAKIHRQVSRRPPDREKDKPCYEIFIDWTDLEEDRDGFIRTMFITDAWTGMVFPYFMQTKESSNERVLEEDEHILDPPEQDGESDADSQENEQAAEQSEPVAEQATGQSYIEPEDHELAKLMEEAFHTPPPTEPDQAPEAVLAVHLPVAADEGWDLEGHPFKADFRQAQEDHMASHERMGSFQEVLRSQTRGQQVLSCMWVFTYKTDKHGYLVGCKARLVVCGNQQAKRDLPTRATTLASMSFRALMAIAAEYDLELEQMDAINAFVNCDLDELKALYGLRRSPLLWQRDLTATLQDLGFSRIPQEPCVMQKGGLIVFFFVDDIIWAYRMVDKALAKEAMAGLQRKYEMSVLGDPKWFLGIHIIRDRAKRSIWLSQEAYIDKIAHQFDIALDSKLPETPMAEEELLPASVQADRRSIELYMKKVGLEASTFQPEPGRQASQSSRPSDSIPVQNQVPRDTTRRYPGCGNIPMCKRCIVRRQHG